jgi:membrane-associated phospholipid phosphatase
LQSSAPWHHQDIILSATDLDDPTVASSGTRVEEADIAAAETLGQLRHDPSVRALGAMSEIADQLPALAVCAAISAGGFIAGRPRVTEAGARMLASVVLATAIKSIIKRFVSRARPHVLLDEGQYDFGRKSEDGGEWHSFPSGHTADAVAAARGLARIFPATSAPAYAVAAGIAAIQIPRAKHYPLDLAGGAAVGIVSELVIDAVAGPLGQRLRREEAGQ